MTIATEKKVPADRLYFKTIEEVPRDGFTYFSTWKNDTITVRWDDSLGAYKFVDKTFKQNGWKTYDQL